MINGVSTTSFRYIRRGVLSTLLLCALLSIHIKPALAACVSPGQILTNHQQGRIDITQHIADEFNTHRDWLVNDFATNQVIPALQHFTEQMSAVAMQQTMAIGMFLDAKHQLETQRLFQELQAQAHKDYQPSTTFCAFGTNVRSLAHSESVGRYNALAQSQRQMARHLGKVNMAGAANAAVDKLARWEQFTNIYCDPTDNNFLTGVANTGLSSICNVPIGTDATNTTNDHPRNRINMDIDYTRAIENVRTLDIARAQDIGSEDEIDIQALGNNLYGHNILFRDISRANILEGDKPKLYLALRSIAAKRSVAENSFNNIVGMKSLGSGSDLFTPPGSTSTINTDFYIGAILKELGIPDSEIANYSYDGSNNNNNVHFSYYAQLEILAKKIYQNPDFYANLYDKPANVKRIGTALKAIDLMLDRAIYESQLRQEMAMSVLLSSRLRIRFDDINKNLK